MIHELEALLALLVTINKEIGHSYLQKRSNAIGISIKLVNPATNETVEIKKDSYAKAIDCSFSENSSSLPSTEWFVGDEDIEILSLNIKRASKDLEKYEDERNVFTEVVSVSFTTQEGESPELILECLFTR